MFLMPESWKRLYMSLRAKTGSSSRRYLWPSCHSLETYQHPHSCVSCLKKKRVFNKLMALSAKRSYVSSYAVGKHIYLFRHFHLGIQKQLAETAMFSVPFSQKCIYLSHLWRYMDKDDVGLCLPKYAHSQLMCCRKAYILLTKDDICTRWRSQDRDVLAFLSTRERAYASVV